MVIIITDLLEWYKILKTNYEHLCTVVNSIEYSDYIHNCNYNFLPNDINKHRNHESVMNINEDKINNIAVNLKDNWNLVE